MWCVCVHGVCVCVCVILGRVRGKLDGVEVSPFTMWALGVELRFPGVVVNTISSAGLFFLNILIPKRKNMSFKKLSLGPRID